MKFRKKLQVSDQVHFKKKSQVLDQLTRVIFMTFLKKNYNDWIKGDSAKSKFKWTGLWCSDQTLVIFLEMKFQKKLQVSDQVHFKKNHKCRIN